MTPGVGLCVTTGAGAVKNDTLYVDTRKCVYEPQMARPFNKSIHFKYTVMFIIKSFEHKVYVTVT